MLIKDDKADVLKEKNDFGVGKVEEIKMLVIQSYDCESAALAYADLSLDHDKQPAHYVVDAKDVIKYAPSTTNLYDTNVVFTDLANRLLPSKKSTFLFDTPLLSTTKGIKELIDRVTDQHSNVKKSLDDDFRGNYT